MIVNLTATDASGNSSSCTATVTVVDGLAPVVACQDITVQLDSNGRVVIAAGDVDNGSTDNCGISSLSLDETDFDCSHLGENTVTLTAMDASGNSSSCTATVTVVDDLAPVVACQDATLELDQNGLASLSVLDIDGGSSDNCSIASMSLDRYDFDTSDIGTQQVTLTVTDSNGNSSTCIANVEILPAGCNVDGGTIATNDERLNLCVGDGVSDYIQVTITGNSGVGKFGLIDAGTHEVVASNNSGIFNMENYPAGNYYLVYASVETLSQFQGVNYVSDLEGCFDVSNFLSVSTFEISAGLISTEGPTTVCINGGSQSKLQFYVTGNFGPNFRWAVLNQAGTNVLKHNSTGKFNFGLAAAGTYQVVHVAYGNINPGSINVSNPQGCVEISTPIFITVESCTSAMPTLSSNPNPVRDISQVEFDVSEGGHATLEVFDLAGRHIQTLYDGYADPSHVHRFAFDGGALPNGVYLYRLTTEKDVILDKFILAK